MGRPLFDTFLNFTKWGIFINTTVCHVGRLTVVARNRYYGYINR